MGLRIHTRSPFLPINPYLHAEAALARWLPPALAEIGQPPADHVVTADCGADAPVITWTGRSGWAPGSVLVAGPQLTLSATPVAAVIPVPLEAMDLPVNDGSGQGLVTVSDGHDDAALLRVIEIATAANRRLTVVTERDATVSPVVSAILAAGEAAGRVDVVRYGATEIPAALAEAAAYVVTSTQRFDMGAVTAMACGTPVIALAGSLSTDVFVHGESGFIAQSVADAAGWIAFLDGLRPSLGRARARLLFDPEMVALRYAELYRSIERQEPVQFQHPEYRSPRGLLTAA